MTTKERKVELYIFIIAAALTSVSYNNLILLDRFPSVLKSFIIGGFFGILGGGLYKLVKNKSFFIKCISLVSLISILFFCSFLLSYLKNKSSEEDAIKKKVKHLVVSTMPEVSSMDTEDIPHLTETQRQKLITCEVCGYKAVMPGIDHCYNCWSEILNSEDNLLEQKKVWLKNEQLRYFSIDNPTDKIDFFTPYMENGFLKDSTWKPVVTEKEVRVFSREFW